MYRVIKHDIPHNKDDTVYIVNLSDTHLGARACDEQALKRAIEWVRDMPNAYAILAGDIVDGHSRKHPYFDESTHAEWLRGENDTLLAMVDKAREFFMPIRDKILAYASGNHEENALAHSNVDLYRMTALAILGDDYQQRMLGHRGGVSVSFRRQLPSGKKGTSWRVNYYITHGSGGGKSVGTPKRKLSEYMQQTDADIVLCGHLHRGEILSAKIFGFASSGTPKFKTRIGIMNPSYVHTTIPTANNVRPISTYADRKDYPLGFVGCSVVVFQPTNQRLSPVLVEDVDLGDVL